MEGNIMMTDIIIDELNYENSAKDYEALLDIIRLTRALSEINQKPKKNFGLQIIKPKEEEKEEIKSLFNEDKLQPYQQEILKHTLKSKNNILTLSELEKIFLKSHIEHIDAITANSKK